jgi:hypothetical protein
MAGGAFSEENEKRILYKLAHTASRDCHSLMIHYVTVALRAC